MHLLAVLAEIRRFVWDDRMRSWRNFTWNVAFYLLPVWPVVFYSLSTKQTPPEVALTLLCMFPSTYLWFRGGVRLCSHPCSRFVAESMGNIQGFIWKMRKICCIVFFFFHMWCSLMYLVSSQYNWAISTEILGQKPLLVFRQDLAWWDAGKWVRFWHTTAMETAYE